MTVVADFRNDSNVSQGTATSSSVESAAGVWTLHTVTGVAPASSTQVRVFLQAGSTPSAADVVYWDNVRVVESAGSGEAAAELNTVERREVLDADATETVVADGSVAAGGALVDRTVASGVAYEYRVTALTDVGAATVGAWTS